MVCKVNVKLWHFRSFNVLMKKSEVFISEIIKILFLNRSKIQTALQIRERMQEIILISLCRKELESQKL